MPLTVTAQRRRPPRATAMSSPPTPRSASSVSLPGLRSTSEDGPPSATLRVTRHYRNGERATSTVLLAELGALHDQRPGRTVCVAWEPAPRAVLVVATPHNARARAALPVVVEAVRRRGGDVEVLVETEKMAALVTKGKRPRVVTTTPWRQDLRVCGIQEEVDLVISLGGDGLILHVVSELFPRAAPPVMPFNLGSMGFLTPFSIRDHEAHIERVLAGEKNLVTMRMRLKCVIMPKGIPCVGNDDSSGASVGTTSADEDVGAEAEERRKASKGAGGGFGDVASSVTGSPSVASADVGDDLACSPCGTQSDRPWANQRLMRFHVLNEIVIDRGPAPYLSNLEVLADDIPVTRVQADGIIVATPTGSTAYSLSAGGSMVHPSVPAILMTPSNPHSLSFRPVLFPHDVTLQIKVPEDARASAWVSFDGRHRMELMRGDSVVVWASDYPVPTFSASDPTSDWFKSLSHCLRWNERVQQASFNSDTGADGEDDGDGQAERDTSPMSADEGLSKVSIS